MLCEVNKFLLLRLVLVLGVMDTLSLLYVILFYTLSVDIVFLVNYTFLGILAVLAFGSLKSGIKVLYSNPYVLSIIFILIMSFVKILYSALTFSELMNGYITNYFYSLIMPLFCFLFVSRFKYDDYGQVIICFTNFARQYAYLAVFFLLVYSGLYFLGYIDYFGLGSNLHYVVPFIMKSNTGFFLIFFVIVVSGKRAVLVTFFSQSIIYWAGSMSRGNKNGVLWLSLVVAILAWLWTETDLFKRLEYLVLIDFDDQYSLMQAFSGRFEEVLGITEFFKQNNYALLVGAAPGEFFMYSAETGNHFYNEPKNFSHVGPFSFAFRYGLIVSLFFYFWAFYCFIRYFDSSSPFYMAFVGVIISSFFGANLLVDPIAWLLVAFFLKFRKYSKLVI